MKELCYTLLSDGSSDRALIPLLTWLIRQHTSDWAIQAQWADLARLPRPPRGLTERIRISLELYPCDLLCVHRDAETAPRETRVGEILSAVKAVYGPANAPTLCVVPVRMQEAWLLFDERALRRAAGNPNGRQLLDVPVLNRLEALPDPKRNLADLLREASGLRGRRRDRLAVSSRASRVATLIDDFSPLRALSAFSALEEEVSQFARVHECRS
jgi:hypothetical protein